MISKSRKLAKYISGKRRCDFDGRNLTQEKNLPLISVSVGLKINKSSSMGQGLCMKF